jgi:hypothetical protein
MPKLARGLFQFAAQRLDSLAADRAGDLVFAPKQPEGRRLVGQLDAQLCASRNAFALAGYGYCRRGGFSAVRPVLAASG